MLWNDTNPSMVLRANETQDAAVKLGVIVQSIGVHDPVGFASAFKAISDDGAAGLLWQTPSRTRIASKSSTSRPSRPCRPSTKYGNS
jgi:hypothetical protein